MNDYLDIAMYKLSETLHNATQSPSSVSKDEILDNIKNILCDYNYSVGYDKIRIVDYRKGK